MGHQAIDFYSTRTFIQIDDNCISQLLLNEQIDNKVLYLKSSDCVFMECKMQSLVPNFFIHNIRELLEKMSEGKEMGSLA